MPFGLQLIAPLRNDAQLLQMALALQQAWAASPDLARPLPDVAALQASQVDLRSIVTHPPLAADTAPAGAGVGTAV